MPVTVGLIVAILVYFVLEIISGVPPFGVTDTDGPALVGVGAIIPGTLQNHDYWRLIAAMFIHIGMLHLLLNLWALFQLGYVFEMMFGSIRFAVTYFASGLIASIASAYFSHGISAGASGAIFGILGALIFAIRRSPVWRHQPWTRNLTRQLVGWAALNVIIGFSMPGIDNAAHLGGFAAGLLLGLIPHQAPPPPPGSMVIEPPSQDSNDRI